MDEVFVEARRDLLWAMLAALLTDGDEPEPPDRDMRDMLDTTTRRRHLRSVT